MKKIIKNGIVVFEDKIEKCDLLIENELIKGFGTFSDLEADEIYDASNMYVLPGGIDPHTHMDLQQSPKYKACDDFYTGTCAAAIGGTTTIIDHIAFGPENCNLHFMLDKYKELAKDSVIDYSFHGVIQHVNDDILEELESIVKNEGVISFKGYSTYGYALTDLDFYELLKKLKECGGILTIHCENDDITNYLRNKLAEEGHTEAKYHAISRPNETESESVDTLLNLAKMAGESSVYIVHTSTKEAVDRIHYSKLNNQKNVYSETCTQYLVFTDDKYNQKNEEAVKYLMAPPLRKSDDIQSLWNAVKNGTVDTIGTDHCPFMLKEKLDGLNDFRLAPGGVNGVEERMRIVFSEGVMKDRIDLVEFAKLTSTNASKIFGMYPKKGTLKIGSDADICIINPNKSEVISANTHHSKSDYNAYEGFKVNCTIDKVFVRGNLVASNNELTIKSGYGQFIHRNPIK